MVSKVDSLRNGLYTTGMDNPLKTVGGEAAVRLLWRLGTTQDRDWIESVVPAEVLDTWTRDRVRLRASYSAETKVKGLHTDLQTQVCQQIARWKAEGLDRWSGRPVDLLDLLKYGGGVPAGTAALGRILSRWPPDHEITLVFQREIRSGSGNPRVWTLSFP